MDNNLKDLMKGAALMMGALEGMNLEELSDMDKEKVEAAQAKAKKEMAKLKRELDSFRKMQSKF